MKKSCDSGLAYNVLMNPKEHGGDMRTTGEKGHKETPQDCGVFSIRHAESQKVMPSKPCQTFLPL